MAFREIPQLKQNTDAERLVSYYKRSYSLVVKELVRLLEEPNISRKLIEQEASLARQIQLIVKQNDEMVLPELEELITKAHTKGQAQALLSLGGAGTLAEATKGVAMSQLAKQSVDKMIQDTFEDALALTDRTDKRIKQTVRDIAGEVMRMNAIQQLGYDTTSQEITNKLLKQGFSKKVSKNFKGVTDSAGRKWRTGDYVNMLVRTKMQQSYMEGIRTESIEQGTDLGVISSHGASDACSNYEGMVISLTGATSGLPTYDELRASNRIFHPNCKHTVTPLRDISLLPESLQKQHEKQLSKFKK